MFWVYGLPENIVTDWGHQFTSRVLQEFCKQLYINVTGLTPFQCVQSYQPPLFPWTGESSTVAAVNEWIRRSERVWDSSHVWLQRAIHSQ